MGAALDRKCVQIDHRRTKRHLGLDGRLGMILVGGSLQGILNPQQQFPEMEGLNHVIFGTQLEP